MKMMLQRLSDWWTGWVWGWTAGPVVCLECGHEWVGVRPATVVLLECTRCGCIAGRETNHLNGKRVDADGFVVAEGDTP